MDNEFNRIRGCETLAEQFTPDDRGYSELNRSAIAGRSDDEWFMFDFRIWPQPDYDA